MGGRGKEVPALTGQLCDVLHVLPQSLVGVFQFLHGGIQPLRHSIQAVGQSAQLIGAVYLARPGHIQIRHAFGDMADLQHRPHQHPAAQKRPQGRNEQNQHQQVRKQM